MSKIISLYLKDEEIARVVDGKFETILKVNGKFAPNFEDWYEDSFYGISNSSFEDRFNLVKTNNYFCYSKPHLKMKATETED